MNTSGFSKARLGRMRDVMAGYVERGEAPGILTAVCRRGEAHVDAIGTTALGDESISGPRPIRRLTTERATHISTVCK